MANQTGVALSIADMSAGAAQASKYIRGSLNFLENEFEASEVVKFMNLGGRLSATVPRPNPDTVGSVYYRNIDGKYTYTKNALEKFTEETKILSYAFKLDVVTNNDPSNDLFKPVPTNLKILAGQWARELFDSMINGDPTLDYQTDPDGVGLRRPPGLRFRLKTGMNGIDQNCRINSTYYQTGGIDLTATGSANAQALVDAVNETRDLVGADFMIMNYRTKTLIQRQQRQGGLLKTTADQYNRQLGDWDGTKIIIPKLKSGARTERNTTDTTQWIMPYEDATGATTPTAAPGSQYASIFFVKSNQEDGFTGFTVNGVQERGPEKLPLPDNALGYSQEMGYGWGTLGFRCIAQLYGLKIG